MTAERAYQRLRDDILGGRYRPSAPLVVQSIADDHDISITPIRDAMHRLLGERLLEHSPGGGFQMPLLTEAELRDLYIWHAQVLRLALKHRATALDISALATVISGLDPEDNIGIVAATATLFDRIGASSRNAEHGAAIRAVAARLQPIRLREQFLRNRIEELRSICALAAADRESAVRDAVWAYHRRRVRRAGQLARC